MTTPISAKQTKPVTAKAILDVSLSGASDAYFASVPKIAIDPRNSQRIAVIWRFLQMNAIGPFGEHREMLCHLSLSTDGGKSFSDRAIDWGLADLPKCNAPYVEIGPTGEIVIGATLARDIPNGTPPDAPHYGRVVFRSSKDWGKSWTPTQSVIATGDEDKFAPNPAVPEQAKRTPWDGARGVIDPQSGTIFVSGGFPAPPGENLHSQRFYRASTDDGKSWGPIRAFASEGWIQRWDGHMIAAHNRLAVTYLADTVPVPDVKCLCLVFATGDGDAKDLKRHFVATVDNFDTLVHYPPLAADPRRKGAYAIALIGKGKAAPSMFLTGNDGASWTTTALRAPSGVIKATRPAIAYSKTGAIVVFWRGERADGSFDEYMAASRNGKTFGRSLRITSESSHIPDRFLKDYSVRGDFINDLVVDARYAHASWTDWREQKGEVRYARVPLSKLLP